MIFTSSLLHFLDRFLIGGTGCYGINLCRGRSRPARKLSDQMRPFNLIIPRRFKYHNKLIPCNPNIIPPVILVISPEVPIRIINYKMCNILILISNKPCQRYNVVQVSPFKPEFPGQVEYANSVLHKHGEHWVTIIA